QIVHPDNYLRPEMNANVAFFSTSTNSFKTATVEVPFSSVITRNQKKMVFLIVGDKAVQRDVKIIGKKTTAYVVEGIQDGDRVVISPPGTLKDKDQIKVVTH